MPIYILRPTARSDDPNWGRAINQGEIVVRASSSGEARAMAALEEASAATGKFPKTTTRVVASALRDPVLYTVVEDTSGRFEAAGPVRVVRGTFHFPDPSQNGEPPA
jgi:hypothetical protein